MTRELETCWQGQIGEIRSTRNWMAAIGLALVTACSFGCADDNAGHTKGGIDAPSATTGAVVMVDKPAATECVCEPDLPSETDKPKSGAVVKPAR